MDLAQLQQALQEHVLHGDTAIATHIVADARFDTALRLGVYADAYCARLAEVLGESFPAVQAALGPARFAREVSDFSRAQPSRFRSVRDYGDRLPDWLAGRLTGPRARGLSELARFEWAVAGAFDAADHAALGPESVAGLSPEQWPQLRLGFSPTLRTLEVHSNCVAWWKHACAEQPRPSRWRATCAQHWLVWRQELAVFYRRMPQAEVRALDAARAGQTFAQWCALLGDAALAAGILHRWFCDALVIEAAPAA